MDASAPGGHGLDGNIAQLCRRHWPEVLAGLVRRLRDLDLAEESLADAVERALIGWRRDGIPDRPGAWLTVTAQRRALDRLRRDARHRSPRQASEVAPAVEPETPTEIPDPELRLLLLFAQPTVSEQNRVPLTLRMMFGLPVPEAARLLRLRPATVAARITRGKRQLGAAPDLELPSGEALASRAEAAANVLYLLFTAGYAPGAGEQVVRFDLAGEAVRLSALLARAAGGARTRALAALLHLQHARSAARTDGEGGLVLLRDQDRTRWDPQMIEDGRRWLAGLATGSGPTEEWRLQALIALAHDQAATAEQTDWRSIGACYARLESLTGSPVVRLNRAVAVAETHGPLAALALLEPVAEPLADNHRYWAVLAELSDRAGRTRVARQAYERALELCDHGPERRFLRARRDCLGK